MSHTEDITSSIVNSLCDVVSHVPVTSLTGKKDVSCTLMATRESGQRQEECFESLPSGTPERFPQRRLTERDCE